jgi:hypothetical protein
MRHVATLFTVVVVCGCSALDPLGGGLTEQGAHTLAKQIGGAFGNGVASSNRAAMVPSPGGPASVPINIQLSQRTNCTAGGNMQVSGSMTGNISNNGSGIILLQVLQTVTD